MRNAHKKKHGNEATSEKTDYQNLSDSLIVWETIAGHENSSGFVP